MNQLKVDTASEVQKAVPPILVAVTHDVTGLTLNDWVMIATLVYIAMQASWLLWKWWKAYKTKGWAPREE